MAIFRFEKGREEFATNGTGMNKIIVTRFNFCSGLTSILSETPYGRRRFSSKVVKFGTP